MLKVYRFGQVRQSMAEVVWSCETSGWWLCGQKGGGDASAREKKTGKTKEEVFGCGEGGHAGGRSEGRWSVWPKCLENPLWRRLIGKPKEEERWQILYLLHKECGCRYFLHNEHLPQHCSYTCIMKHDNQDIIYFQTNDCVNMFKPCSLINDSTVMKTKLVAYHITKLLPSLPQIQQLSWGNNKITEWVMCQNNQNFICMPLTRKCNSCYEVYRQLYI